MNPDIYKLLIVDDHPIVAEGIVSIASQQSNILCKSITRMENLLPTISAESFDLCIIDLELPEINGFQLIHLLQEQMPDCKILIYTMHEEPWVIAKLAEEEISGAVSKNASTSELKQAINQIRLGHKYFSEVFSILHKKQKNTRIVKTRKRGAHLSLRRSQHFRDIRPAVPQHKYDTNIPETSDGKTGSKECSRARV